MVRLTATELATILGKPNHWVYHALKKTCNDKIHKVLDEDQIYKVFKYSFMVKNLENIEYEKIVDPYYTTLVLTTKMVKLKDKLGRIDDRVFAELIIAIKATNPNYTVFNILFYACKSLGLPREIRDHLKEIIYLKFVENCIYKSQPSNYLFCLTKFCDLQLETELMAVLKKKMFNDLLNNKFFLRSNNGKLPGDGLSVRTSDLPVDVRPN
jgi:hypothetical protein